MKKQILTSVLLKLKKTNIANLNYIKGGHANVNSQSNCCSNPDDTCQTITTRPDSLVKRKTTTD
ncbi:hypothetical protein H2O64_12895 [Kordia sp. YSTF-M3]|uniref:Natural product n=1 Tax=Kordia aestuariivivens TaxID=2759037 RepID=A0ABR7QAF9_9FLAO|nr:hypothetical protein [Kordia aestuariivivens]MBC8755567.1 hypothetical protein [Kordia aestuariivivens]